LEDNIDTIKRNIEAVIDASKEVGLEVNTEEATNMLMSHHKNVGQTHNIKAANRSFENVTQFRSLGMIIRDQNLIHEEVKIRLN
jgi:hypothetical protein